MFSSTGLMDVYSEFLDMRRMLFNLICRIVNTGTVFSRYLFTFSDYCIGISARFFFSFSFNSSHWARLELTSKVLIFQPYALFKCHNVSYLLF